MANRRRKGPTARKRAANHPSKKPRLFSKQQPKALQAIPADSLKVPTLPTDDRAARWWLGAISAIVCITAMMMGIQTSSQTLKLFHPPPITYAHGFVAIGFADQFGLVNIPVSIEEDIDDSRSTDSVMYTIRFPKAAAGKRWELLMAGDAALSAAFATNTDGTILPITSIACPPLPSCQVLKGQLPTNLSEGQAEGRDQFCASSLASPDTIGIVEVSGTGNLFTERPGGRKSVLVPNDPDSSLTLNGTIRSADFHGIDPAYLESGATYCKRVEFSTDLEATTVTPTAQYSAEDRVAWLTTEKRGIASLASAEALTLSPKNLASKENSGIVAVGVEFALLCGFLPVLVDSCVRGGLAWYRRRLGAA